MSEKVIKITNIPTQAHAWDNKRAATYINPWERDGEVGMSEFARLAEIFSAHNIFNKGNILDLACGKGTLLPFIKLQIGPDAEVTELDGSYHMLLGAVAMADALNMTHTAFVQDDAENPSLPSNTFDTIIVFNAFPHMANPRGAMEAWSKLLKRGGKLIIMHSKSRALLNESARRHNPKLRGDVLPSQQTLFTIIHEEGLKITTYVDHNEKDYFLLQAENI